MTKVQYSKWGNISMNINDIVSMIKDEKDRNTVYIILRLHIPRDKTKELNKIEDTPYFYPDIVRVVECDDYINALKESIELMNSNYEFLLDGEDDFLEVFYPIEFTDKIRNSLKNGTFFNRAVQLKTARNIMNSDAQSHCDLLNETQILTENIRYMFYYRIYNSFAPFKTQEQLRKEASLALNTFNKRINKLKALSVVATKSLLQGGLNKEEAV